jgi:hypothetical protein
MNKTRLLMMAGLLAGAAVTVSAQTMKPGLWEMSSKMAGGSGDMGKAMAEAQKSMDSMPPAQRKKMEEMMAKQGVSMGKPGTGMTVKVCMTQEMIDRHQVSPTEGKCKQTNSQKTGNTIKFSIVCTEPPSSGDGQVVFSSPEAFTTQMTLRTTRQGQAQTMEMASSGKFLAKDCGAIKPLALPKP